MSADISDKVVMVTGAGGSIGSELCRQILNCRPTKLLLFELSEFALYSIDKELRETQAAASSQIRSRTPAWFCTKQRTPDQRHDRVRR